MVLADKQYFQKLMGSILYISCRTRPDVFTAINILSQNMQAPTIFHLQCAKRILSYLLHTKNFALVYRKSEETIRVTAYVDSDHAGDSSDRKSRSGWIISLNGCTFCWYSKKQKTVALSSSEAEYMAMSECCRSLRAFQIFINEFRIYLIDCMDMYCDNNCAIDWSKSEKSLKGAKHVEVRYHFIRDCVAEGVVTPQKVNSMDNLSDLMTKPLAIILFEKFRNSIGLVDLQTSSPKGR